MARQLLLFCKKSRLTHDRSRENSPADFYKQKGQASGILDAVLLIGAAAVLPFIDSHTAVITKACFFFSFVAVMINGIACIVPPAPAAAGSILEFFRIKCLKFRFDFVYISLGKLKANCLRSLYDCLCSVLSKILAVDAVQFLPELFFQLLITL